MWKIAGFALLVVLQVSVAQRQPGRGRVAGCPQDCFCYPNNVAYCRNMASIPVGLNPRTRGLLIADSSLTTIPKNAFMGLPYLVELNITDNLVSSIHPDAFNGLKKLQRLDLSNNKFKTFPGAALAKISKGLTSLNLGGNLIAGSLTADSFKGMEALEVLYMYNTNFTTVEDGLFSSLKKLTVLDLSKNNFQSLPEGAIKGLDNLKEIIMFGNPFACNKDASWLSGWIEKNPPEIGAGPTCMDPPRFAGYAAAALPSAVLGGEYEMVTIDCTVEATPPPEGDGRPPPVQAASIKGLVWKCPGTTVLKAGQFEEYTDLEELDISGNGIVDIEPGAFSSLNKLRVLYLSDNLMTRMKAPVLNDLKSLEIFDVSGNKFTYLPADIKERLPKIEFIVGYNNPWSCDCNLAANMDLIAHYFHEIPAICAAPQELEGREVREVPEEAMICTPPVITFIDEYVTVKEGGDAFLNCEISGLPVPPARWKTPDGKVVTIDEPVGNKEVLGNGTLWIKSVTGDDGGNYVCIADNGGGIARGNATLRVCPKVCRCLDILTVHCFDDEVSKIPSDTRLFLMLGTDLTEVKKGLFKDLKNLEELDLDNNQISDIETGSFEDLSNLRLLFLYRNAMEKLQSGLFKGMTNLLQIYLSSNNITTVEDGAFEGLENLQLIQLHKNQIEEIGDGAFKGLPTLIDLDLHLNNLSTIPGKAISSLSNLKRVQLFENRITMVKEDDFKDLENLQMIYLQNNFIQVVENGAFANLPALQWLDLSGNNIVVIPAGVFKGLDALQRLDLSNNALVTLPASLRTELPSLKFVIGAGNPWHCDCNMIPLRGWFGYSADQPPLPGSGPVSGDPPYRPYYEPDPLLNQEFLQYAGQGPYQTVGGGQYGGQYGGGQYGGQYGGGQYGGGQYGGGYDYSQQYGAGGGGYGQQYQYGAGGGSYGQQYQYGAGGGYDYGQQYGGAYGGQQGGAYGGYDYSQQYGGGGYAQGGSYQYGQGGGYAQGGSYQYGGQGGGGSAADSAFLERIRQLRGESSSSSANTYSYQFYRNRRRRQAPGGGFATCASPFAYANQDINTIPISSLICEAILFVENGLAILVGEAASMPCNITKEIGIGKFWVTPQGTVVKFGGSEDRVKVADDGTLSIEAVTEEDAGPYVCMGGDLPEVYFLNYVKEVTTLPPPPATEAPIVDVEGGAPEFPEGDFDGIPPEFPGPGGEEFPPFLPGGEEFPFPDGGEFPDFPELFPPEPFRPGRGRGDVKK
ncbi:uncharacterized protein LOC144907026 [Branchiostoma floridae x Branchiostoma belcheri]